MNNRIKATRVFLVFLGALSLTQASAQDGLGLDTHSLRAQLVPVRQATLSAEMAGKLITLNVHEGQSVKQGGVLAEFDCSVPRAQLDKARMDLGIAQNTLKGNKRLFEMNALGEVELNNSQLQVGKAEAEVSYLKAVLSRCTVRAPYSGQVTQVYAHGSEFIQSGAKLMDIQEGGKLQLEFIAPSAWLTWLRKGSEFMVSIEDTAKDYKATVDYTNVKVDPMSQSVKVVASIKGKHEELLAGMSGLIHLEPNHSVVSQK